jgi:hypothetical protein
MNSSLITADTTTHLKIVAVALLAVIAVIWIGIGTRLNVGRGPLPSPALERPSSAPAAPIPLQTGIGSAMA